MSHGQEIHGGSGYGRAIEAERAGKDDFFRSSPHSPIDPGARARFSGLRYFPIDPALRLEGLRLMPYVGDGPVAFAMATSDGRVREANRVGAFSFKLNGRAQALVAYRLPGAGSHTLFVPFMDATSGSETYGAGRYLDLEPARDGRYVLDFNLAYHPYCAHSPHFSCPLTPEENRLGIRIEAGERFDEQAT